MAVVSEIALACSKRATPLAQARSLLAKSALKAAPGSAGSGSGKPRGPGGHSPRQAGTVARGLALFRCLWQVLLVLPSAACISLLRGAPLERDASLAQPWIDVSPP